MQEHLGRWLQKPSPDISDLTPRIVASLETHPDFREGTSRFFGTKQLVFNSTFQAANLLRVTVARDPGKAVAWLRKVFSTDTADIRFLAEVYGLEVAARHELGNGVALMPFDALPASPNAKAIAAQFQFLPGRSPLSFRLPIGVTLEVRDVHGSKDFEKAALNPQTRECAEQLVRSVKAFTLVDGAAPVVGISWVEFVDPDLALAEVGRMWTGPTFEGVLGRAQPVQVDSAAICWAERYLELKPQLKAKCDVAIDRLNLARRRLSPGDKAIEGAICLEALLGDEDATSEVTYRLALRAALLLESRLAERRQIRKAVTQFYALRSRTVHGVSPTSRKAEKDGLMATDGLEICARALRHFVQLNQMPLLSDWELSGGGPAL